MNGIDNVERFLKQMAAADAGAPVPSASAVSWRAELRRWLRSKNAPLGPCGSPRASRAPCARSRPRSSPRKWALCECYKFLSTKL